MKKELALLIIIIASVLSFMLGYSLAPGDRIARVGGGSASAPGYGDEKAPAKAKAPGYDDSDAAPAAPAGPKAPRKPAAPAYND